MAGEASSFGAAAPYLMIAGAVSSAAGSYYSAKSQRYQTQSANLARDFEAITRKNQLLSKALDLDLESFLANLNAKNFRASAENMLAAGNIRVSQLKQKVGVMKAKQRVGYASRGIDLGSRSVAEVSYSSDMMADADAAIILENAMKAAWGEQTKATNMENQAMLMQMTANNYRSTPVNASHMIDVSNPAGSALTSLLNSAGQVATSWYLNN